VIGKELSVETVNHPEARTFDGEPFPPALACRSPRATLVEVCRWVERERDELIQRSSAHGALLFRGFPLGSAADFDAFVAAFGFESFSYDESLSNAVRVNLTERVFTANEAPPSATIRLHHEMAQTPVCPSRLFFFCHRPADRGGATSLCRSDLLFRRLSERAPDFAVDCERRGLRYTNVLPDEDDPDSALGRSWRSTLGVATRERAEAKLRSLGYTWEWRDDGCLCATSPTLPAVHRDESGRKAFFNQLIATRGWRDVRNDPATAVTFGDGTPVHAADIDLAESLAEEMAVDVVWQAGDVALVDNFVVMHGRRSFSGERSVYASLVRAPAWAAAD